MHDYSIITMAYHWSHKGSLYQGSTVEKISWYKLKLVRKNGKDITAHQSNPV